MTPREKQKIISVIEAAKIGIEKARGKSDSGESLDRYTIYYLNGQIAGYEAVLRMLKTSDISELVLWVPIQHRTLIEDILDNKRSNTE